jgi:hypothetical protein
MHLCGRGRSENFSVPQRPHYPASQNQPAHEQGEAVEAVVELRSWSVALSNTEDSGSKDREQQRSIEVGECQNHDFFPIAM